MRCSSHFTDRNQALFYILRLVYTAKVMWEKSHCGLDNFWSVTEMTLPLCAAPSSTDCSYSLPTSQKQYLPG